MFYKPRVPLECLIFFFWTLLNHERSTSGLIEGSHGCFRVTHSFKERLLLMNVLSLRVCNEYPPPSRTIWYELHAREWPFKNQPAEVIIWQVGSGMRPNLTQIGMGKEISVSAA